ncbi:creatininase family protein [Maribacter sp. 2307ULW6-5]|uniref:creatininase family protein n=1 Tax=Maribacter sp. 2307ULW6-5 TaxID=3386275 RepID=UPI0039BC42DD
MIRPYILSETNWGHLEHGQVELAILPWGATEAHNYHLPYATDNYQATAIVEEAAGQAWKKGNRVMVLPTVPYGVNTGQPDIYLDMNLNPSTQLAILRDLVAVLHRQGIHKLLIFNGHGGNDFKPMVREVGLEFPDMFISLSFFPQLVEKDLYFEAPGDHADEMETSLMLHLHPQLVLPREKWGSGAAKKWKIQALNGAGVWAERKWSSVSEDTGVGDPKKATAAKGARFFKDVCHTLAIIFQDICEVDKDDLYM